MSQASVPHYEKPIEQRLEEAEQLISDLAHIVQVHRLDKMFDVRAFRLCEFMCAIGDPPRSAVLSQAPAQ